MSTITHAQYHTARTLAAALGHRWALLDATLAIATPTTPSDIRAACILALLAEDDGDDSPGILAPRMDGDAIRHISASGSIRYVVHDDGSAQIILRDDVESWYIARAYAEVAAACVTLAAQGRRIDLSRGRPSHRDDLGWGMPEGVVYSRAARQAADRHLTEEEAVNLFSAEVSASPAAIDQFVEFFRGCGVAYPADAYVPCVETVARRTTTTTEPSGPFKAFSEVFADAAKAMSARECEMVEPLRAEVLRAAEAAQGSISYADIVRAASLLSLTILPSAAAWGVVQRRVGLLEARSAMVLHVPDILPVWRALGRKDEASVLASYASQVEGCR